MEDFNLEDEAQPVFRPGKKGGMNISQYKPPVEKERMKPGTKPEQFNKLNGYAEQIIEDLLNNMTFRQLAEKYEVGLATFFSWRYKSEHSPIIEQAMLWSSEMDQQKAEQVLLDGEDSGLPDIIRRKALSEFYKWRASKRAPKVFGNQEQTVEVTVNHNLSQGQFKDILEQVKNKRINEPTESGDTDSDEPEEIDYEETEEGK